jgi:hypothetical protein
VRRLRADVDREAARSLRPVPEPILPSLQPHDDNIVGRLYGALLALEGNARDLDVAELRRSVEVFAVDVAAIALPILRKRFSALADRLGAVVDALELGDAAAARQALADGLSAFALT